MSMKRKLRDKKGIKITYLKKYTSSSENTNMRETRYHSFYSTSLCKTFRMNEIKQQLIQLQNLGKLEADNYLDVID
jgi:hypothetical protein